MADLASVSDPLSILTPRSLLPEPVGRELSDLEEIFSGSRTPAIAMWLGRER